MRHRLAQLPLALLLFCTSPISEVAAEVSQGVDRDAGTGADGGRGASLPDSPSLVPNTGSGPDASSNDTAAPGQTAAAASATTVMQAVRGLRGLSNWTVIPFAHFRRGRRHVVVAWPAINSAGRLVDATVVGICLEANAEGTFEECGRRWVVRDQAASRAALLAALGGPDFEVIGRDAGAPLTELGPRLSELGTAFGRAVSSQDRDGAVRAAAAFTTMLPIERVALENGVAQLLWAAATHDGRLEHVETLRQGNSAVLTFHVMRGRRRFRTIRAQAQQVRGQGDRWIVTSYQ